MKYSTNKIKNAGKKLIEIANDGESLEILSFWRSMHAEPLESATVLVEKHGKRINPKVLIAKRLKRTESIVNKLSRLEKKVQLSTMNDIAGCRAILVDLKEVNKLVGKLSRDKTFRIFRDYINNPKKSGYRSIHMIGQFINSDYKKQMHVELQIRTFVQHSWATAIEIVDLFTKDSIKTNQGRSKEWSDFFIKLSKIFYAIDNSFNSVSQHNVDVKDKDKYYTSAYNIFLKECSKQKLHNEIEAMCSLIEKLDIVDKFQIFTRSVKLTTETNKDKIFFEDGYVLLIIDKTENGDFNVLSRGYPDDLADKANADYLEAEKDVILNKHYVTALVSSNAMGEIQKAYPNYFADSTNFIEYIFMIIAAKKEFDKINNLKMQENFKSLQPLMELGKEKFF